MLHQMRIMRMADISHPENRFQIDRVWAFAAVLPLIIALFDWEQAIETVRFAMTAMSQTGVFIAFAVLAVGYLKASGSETRSRGIPRGQTARRSLTRSRYSGLINRLHDLSV